MPPIVHSSCAHDTILAWLGLALTYIIGCAADLLSRCMAGKGLRKLKRGGADNKEEEGEEKFTFKPHRENFQTFVDSLPDGENFRLPFHCK